MYQKHDKWMLHISTTLNQKKRRQVFVVIKEEGSTYFLRTIKLNYCSTWSYLSENTSSFTAALEKGDNSAQRSQKRRKRKRPTPF